MHEVFTKKENNVIISEKNIKKINYISQHDIFYFVYSMTLKIEYNSNSQIQKELR